MDGIIIIIVIVIGVVIANSSDKYNGYEISELSLIEKSYNATPELKGSIQNKSNNTAKKLTIRVEISSGTLKKDCFVIMDSPKVGEIISFEETLYGATGITNIENYKVTLKEIEIK